MIETMLNGKYWLSVPECRAAQYQRVGGWEPERLDALMVASGPGETVFYVGGEQGEIPALVSQAGANVVIFEPTPTAWPTIRWIYDANGLDAPWCFWGFASDVDERIASVPTEVFERPQFIASDVSRVWPECARLNTSKAYGFGELHNEADSYPQITLDVAAGKVGQPSVIAMDVEGSEWQVLKGAKDLLVDVKPMLLVSIHREFMRDNWGQSADEFRDWVKSFGYAETILADEHEMHAQYVRVKP